MPETDRLDDFMNGLPPATPLPAAEVRRRGDRLRRRHTALSVGGGALAAALVVGGPVLALGGHDDDGIAPVAPSPTPTSAPATATDWLTAVPKEFPLAQGLPSPHQGPAVIDTVGGRAPTADLVPVCGSQAWSLDGSVTARVASHQGESEDQAYRTIALYPDQDAARAALQELRDAVSACPAADSLVYAPVQVDLGTDESYAYSEQANLDDLLSDLTVVEVARTGNALLFDSTYGSVGGDAAVRGQTQQLLERSEPTRSTMCLFAASPCTISTGGGSSAAPTSHDIPDGLDLLAGVRLGSDGTVQGDGPSRDADGVSLADLCGTTAWPPAEETDRLALVATAPEYQLNRELVTFADADQAAAALQAVHEAVAACPVARAAKSGDDRLFVQTNADTGYDDVTFVQTYRTGLGGGVYQFIRVGRAVLATVETGELGPGSIGPSVRYLTTENAAVTPQLCVFTAAGC